MLVGTRLINSSRTSTLVSTPASAKESLSLCHTEALAAGELDSGTPDLRPWIALLYAQLNLDTADGGVRSAATRR